MRHPVVLILGLTAVVGLSAAASASDIQTGADLAALEDVVDAAWTNNPMSKVMPPGDMEYNNHLGPVGYQDGFETNFLDALIPVTNGAAPDTYVRYPFEVIETVSGSDRLRLYYSALSTNPAAIHTTTVTIANYPEDWIEDTYGEPPDWLSGGDLQQWYDDRDPARQYLSTDLMSTGSIPAYLVSLTNGTAGGSGENTNMSALIALYSNDVAFVDIQSATPCIDLYLHAPSNVPTLDLLVSTNLMEPYGWTLPATLAHTVNPILWTYAGPEPIAFFASGDSSVDTDGDGLADIREMRIYGTSASQADSDGDGLSDGIEILTCDLNALSVDTDGDGVSDFYDLQGTTSNVFAEIVITTNLPTYYQYDYGQGDNTPHYVTTLEFAPVLPENVVSVRTVTISGYVDDACKINGDEYPSTLWNAEGTSFTNVDITVSVTNRKDGSFDIQVYDWASPEWDPNNVEFNGNATLTCMSMVVVEFVHAEGGDVGQPMNDLPVFTPSLGTNAGMPVYDNPDEDLILEISGAFSSNAVDSMDVTYLGNLYATSETGIDTLSFTNGTITVTLADAPLADTNVQEYLDATVSMLSCGITNAPYECIEVTAASLEFMNDPQGLVISLSGLGAGVVDTMNVKMRGPVNFDRDLSETATNSLCFTASNLTVRLVNEPVLTSSNDTLWGAVSDSHDLSNTVFSVQETAATSKVFRNYDEPTPTSLSDIPVPDFVPWRVKIRGISDSNLVTSFSLRTAMDTNSQATFSTVASLLSDQKFILASSSASAQDLPSGYEVLRIDDTALDWSDEASQDVVADIQLVAMASPVSIAKKRAQPGAVVLQSLDWMSRMGQGLDPESRIRAPLKEMGYSTIRDYKAKKNDTLTKYIKGKQVWYSMSHGSTVDGTPHSQFNGLLFIDGGIKASDIQPLDVNYRLVMADGCCSAQTSVDSYSGAKQSNTLTAGAKAFAEAFGPDSAYMGWGWEMEPNSAQSWTAEFVANLKFAANLGRGRTVQEAHKLFLDEHPGGQSFSRLMKIYRNTDNIIDLRSTDQ